MYGIWLLCVMVMLIPMAAAQEMVDIEVQTLNNSVLVKFSGVTDTMKDLVMWFVSDNTISSYVVQDGWHATSSSDSIWIMGDVQPGESLGVGLNYDGEAPQLAWQANIGAEEHTGWLLGENMVDIAEEPAQTIQDDTSEAEPPATAAITSESRFRIIPDKPSAGSTVRIAGEGFGGDQRMALEIGGYPVDAVTAGPGGTFVATRTIPDGLTGRVDIVVQDMYGDSLGISIRLAEEQDVRPIATEAQLAIEVGAGTYTTGEFLEVAISAGPVSTVVVSLTGPGQTLLTTKAVQTDHEGMWYSDHDIIIPYGAREGRYTIQVNDGANVISEIVRIESDADIAVRPTKSIFEPGDTLRFVGQVRTDSDVYFILQDPDGTELALESNRVDSTGTISWEYDTKPNFRTGTYTLLVMQDDDTHFVYAGLGSLVEVPISINFDKSAYLPSEKPLISIASEPMDVLTLLILTPSDNIIHRDIIHVRQDGRAVYMLDLERYPSGVYTAIIKEGTVQSDYRFGVGLKTGVSDIEITSKAAHEPGESILLLGNTDPDAVLAISLVDPNGHTVQTINTFSDKTGSISEKRLRVPPDAQQGTWSIKATSGPNSDIIQTEVEDTDISHMRVVVLESDDGLQIRVTGAVETSSVTITITQGGDPVGTAMRAYITAEGIGQIPWNWDVPGRYIITATTIDGDRAQTVYDHR